MKYVLASFVACFAILSVAPAKAGPLSPEEPPLTDTNIVTYTQSDAAGVVISMDSAWGTCLSMPSQIQFIYPLVPESKSFLSVVR